ncbi:MAG: lysostaphin resistance A-like protein [Phycisphaerales bacterium]
MILSAMPERGSDSWLARWLGARRDVSGVESAVWLTAALAVFIAPILGGSIAAQMPETVIGDADSVRRIAATQLAGFGLALVVGVVMVGLLRRGAGAGADRAGLTIGPMDPVRGAVWLAAIVPLYVLVSRGATWVDRAVRGERGETIQHETLKRLSAAFEGSGGEDRAWAWVVVASVVVLVPAVEEILYRGFLQSLFVRVLAPGGGRGAGGRWGAIAATSVVFALMHVATGVVPWSAGVALLTLSIALGVAFERTGRLGVPIVMHALFNAANVAVVAFGGLSASS